MVYIRKIEKEKLKIYSLFPKYRNTNDDTN